MRHGNKKGKGKGWKKKKCSFCGKEVKLATWYYRGGYYYCSKGHWRKEKEAEEMKDE